MTPVLLAPLAALLLGQAAPAKAPATTPPAPPPERATRSEEVRRLTPEDQEVVRNLELLERLELLQRLELFDAAGDDEAAEQRDRATPRR